MTCVQKKGSGNCAPLRACEKIDQLTLFKFVCETKPRGHCVCLPIYLHLRQTVVQSTDPDPFKASILTKNLNDPVRITPSLKTMLSSRRALSG